MAVDNPLHRTSLVRDISTQDNDDTGEEDLGLSEHENQIDEIPNPERHCTDLFWLALFVLYLGGMVGLSILGFINGDPARLVYATNHEGKLCGQDYPSKPFIAFPRANEDLIALGFSEGGINPSQVRFFGVCVESCPLAGDYVCTEVGEAAVSAQVKATGKNRESILYGCVNQWYSTIPFGEACLDESIRSQCYETDLDTESVFFRCLPQYVYEKEVLPESGCIRFKNVTTLSGEVKQICTVFKEVTKITREQPTASNLLFDTYNSLSVRVKSYFGDLVKAYKPILLSGFGVSLTVGLLYVASLWCCVGVMVWVTVILSMLVSLTFTLYCYFKAGILTTSMAEDVFSFLSNAQSSIQDSTDKFLDFADVNTTVELGEPINVTGLPAAFSESIEYTTEYRYAAYAATALTVLLVLLVFTLAERIARAIEVFAEASKAIRKNLFLVLVPFISMTFFFAVITAWSVCTAYIASAGSFEVQQLNQTFSVASKDKVAEIKYVGDLSYNNLFVMYMLLGLLWILNFLNGVTVMTVSGTVLRWFWTDEVARDTEKHTPFPILKSFYVTLRYHLGTIAFGSLVLAFIQFIRYIAAAIEKRLTATEKNSKVLKLLFCAFQCLLACVQRFIHFVTRNAYIMSAMYGTGFCTSTVSAFRTVASNITQVALVTFLGDLIQRFGQILITLTTGLTCWVYLDQFPEYSFGGELQLNSFVFPVLVAMFCGWFVSAEVLSVYDITVDTILLSFCQDQRLKKYKEGHAERSPQSVKDFVNKNSPSDKGLVKQASFSTIY